MLTFKKQEVWWPINKFGKKDVLGVTSLGSVFLSTKWRLCGSLTLKVNTAIRKTMERVNLMLSDAIFTHFPMALIALTRKVTETSLRLLWVTFFLSARRPSLGFQPRDPPDGSNLGDLCVWQVVDNSVAATSHYRRRRKNGVDDHDSEFLIVFHSGRTYGGHELIIGRLRCLPSW